MVREFRVRDPIHGFIALTAVEHELVDSAAFQRLRNIRQLSFTYLAYPGAEHSRFGHSLGVAAFSGRMFDSLVRKHKDLFAKEKHWNNEDIERNRQLLRLASLLHDVGHPPFSHASEGSFANGLSHEDYTRKVILESDIATIIDKHKQSTGISSQDVAKFFSLHGKIEHVVAFLTPIFAGEVDSDKMDYLLRDSLYAGVTYGKYDYARLIESLCLIENPSKDGNFIIGIEEGGVHALEGLILARYFMFTQVYYHKAARAYYLHLAQLLRDLAFTYPIDANEFLSWDDRRMIGHLQDNRNNKHAAIILDRKHYKLAYKSSEHPDKEEYKQTVAFEKAISSNFGTSDVFCDYAEKASHKFHRINFFVKCDDGKNVLINQFSGIIARLEKIDQFRVYCDKSLRDKVMAFCQEFP